MKGREVETVLLTINEAAKAFRVGHRVVRNWVAQGVLPVVRWGPRSDPLIRVADVHAFIEHNLRRDTERDVEQSESDRWGSANA
jgi:excisionase family DNA binding protein